MKNILIVGSSAKEYALALKLKNEGHNVFVASGNKRISDIAKCIDIREDNISELLKFVINNSIDLTIAISQKAIINDIASVFQANEQKIFAPTAKSAEFTYSHSTAKRLLYKMRIPSPHFGIYDKAQSAFDYLKNAPMPQVINSDNTTEKLVCTTFNTSKIFVEDLFCKGEEKVILEDYVYGHEFTFYVITDGYHCVPLATVANYKFMEDGDGGILTDGIGCYTPDYKISKEIENNLVKKVINPTLEYLQKKESPYLGIIGVECVLREDGKIITLRFKSFLSDHDCQAVLNLVEDNLYNLFEACINGSFEDYNNIESSDKSSISCVLSSRIKNSTINGLDIIDADITPFNINKNEYLEFETIEGKNLVLTSCASTLSNARKKLYEDIEHIKFDGIKYRTDICENVEKF